MPLSLHTQLQVKEVEIKSLLETVKAININANEENLYRLYNFTLRSIKQIRKMALYLPAPDGHWAHKSSFGTQANYHLIPFDERIGQKVPLQEVEHFNEFDQVLPILHQGKVLAYTFFGFDKRDAVISSDFLEAFCNIILVAIENQRKRQVELEKENYLSQMEIAKQVQGLLFPKKLPMTPHLQIRVSYRPHHQIGGDYYDYVELAGGKFLICIADVSGKGVPAALLMANFQAGVRLLARQNQELTQIVHTLNAMIMESAQGDHFITGLFAIYDPQIQELRYINAGHNAPFLWHQGAWSRLEANTIPLGAFQKLPFLKEIIIPKAHAFFLFCFTDGFIESVSSNNQVVYVDEVYLQKFLNAHVEAELHIIQDKLTNLLQKLRGSNEYSDDITLLFCRVQYDAKKTDVPSFD